MEYAPPQFFHRGPAPIARLTFFALLSVLLMVLDARFRYAEPMRQLLALAVYPLQQLAIAPVSALSHSRDFFATQARLQAMQNQGRSESVGQAQANLTGAQAKLDALLGQMSTQQKAAQMVMGQNPADSNVSNLSLGNVFSGGSIEPPGGPSGSRPGLVW